MTRLLLFFSLFSVLCTYAQPAIQNPPDFTVCYFESGMSDYDLTQKNAEILNGLNPDEHTVLYFLDGADILDDSNAITILQFPPASAFVMIDYKVTEIATGLWSWGQFKVSRHYIPAVPLPDLIKYETDYDGLSLFSLSSQTQFVADNIMYEVSYHLSLGDAQQGINPLPTSGAYQNIANPQTVYVRFGNSSVSCYNVTSFKLIVNEGTDPIINFTNPTLKTKLLQSSTTNTIARRGNKNVKIDKNNDGNIQLSEIQFPTRFDFFSNTPSGTVTSVDELSNFPHVIEIYSPNHLITSVNLQAPTLKKLFLANNDIVSYDLSGTPLLQELNLGMNLLEGTFDAAGFPNLTNLQLHNNNFNAIINLPAGLRHFNISNNNISALDLSLCGSYLFSLNADDNDLTSLDLSNGTEIALITARNNSITQFSYSGSGQCAVHLSGNPIQHIDLSGAATLQSVSADNCPLLVSINMKNGSTIIDPEFSAFGNSPNLAYLCVDEGEGDVLLQHATENGLTELVNINSYCTPTPGGKYNTITGLIKLDANTNGCETTDAAMMWSNINIFNGTDNITLVSNDAGAYNFYTHTGNFTVAPEVDNALYTVTPESVPVSFTEVEQLVETQDFCVTPIGTVHDVEIALVPTIDARPGFDANYKIIYKNIGNQVVSGAITLEFEDAYVDFINSSLAPASSAPGVLTWNFNNIQPSESGVIVLTFNVNGPMETPAVNINDVLNYTAAVSIPETDATPGNNVMGIKQVVVGSLDPNDITCLEGDTVVPELIGEYLHYNINFENIGTAAATFVIVENDIDAANYDLSTLEFLYASHNMTATIEGNKITCRFDDIDLGANEKGNFVYKIKTLNTLQVNDAVTQQANIFFDYNWPLETNEATTVFAALNTGDFTRDASIKVYPNPSNGIVNISANMNIESYELYDIQGRLLQTSIVNDAVAKLDISQRTSGMYFVKVKTEAGVKVEKIVKE